MSGLGKCFGHPIINMTESVKTWIGKGAVSKPGVGHMGAQIANMFKLTFCRQYYKEKRVWPALRVLPGLSERIQNCISSNIWKEDARNPWKAEEFEFLVLNQTFM
ncbi:unnamed protein product [Phaedon cochleariae]|uniref:Uncharacterized protein n=1 Tax=Phaedon cochleariae TaxID=80249 RepID=A0A9N9SM08_PHACE|nr:unnamed protein product [Phaedon cochleariae]